MFGAIGRVFGSRRSRGYPRSNVVLSFSHDGLAIARVKSNRRWLPIWHIIFFVYVALLIRLVIIADMGPGGYQARMLELQSGNVIERAAARIMALDPVSQSIATRIRASLMSINENVFERES